MSATYVALVDAKVLEHMSPLERRRHRAPLRASLSLRRARLSGLSFRVLEFEALKKLGSVWDLGVGLYRMC